MNPIINMRTYLYFLIQKMDFLCILAKAILGDENDLPKENYKNSFLFDQVNEHFPCKFTDPSLEYRNFAVLGRGPYGIVYQSVEIKSGKMYAIKTVNLSSKHKAILAKEPEFLSALSGSEFIIHMKECYIYDGSLHIVLELCIGDLWSYISGGEYTIHSERITFEIFRQMVYAVKDCHSLNIIHSDIKPTNFLIAEYNSNIPRILLSDFGVSQFSKKGELLSICPGTMQFSSPELVRMKPSDGRRNDIWALGVNLYILYHSTLPFGRNIPLNNPDYNDMLKYDILYGEVQYHPSIPNDLMNLIKMCLSRFTNPPPSIDAVISSKWFVRNS